MNKPVPQLPHNDYMWTLNEGIAEAQLLDPLLRPHNAFVALTGGVLHRGSSTKDLDLVIIPLKNRLTLRQYIKISKILSKRYNKLHHVVNTAKYGDDKYVEVYYTHDKKRIDVFFLNSGGSFIDAL